MSDNDNGPLIQDSQKKTSYTQDVGCQIRDELLHLNTINVIVTITPIVRSTALQAWSSVTNPPESTAAASRGTRMLQKIRDSTEFKERSDHDSPTAPENNVK